MNKLTQRLVVVVLSLVGTHALAQTLAFELPNKATQKCDLVSRGEQVYFDVYLGMPDYIGVYYEGPLDGVTSSGVPVSCNATISLRSRRHGLIATLETDSMTIGDSCEATRLKMSTPYYYRPFGK
jgi:hypothetical protein